MATEMNNHETLFKAVAEQYWNVGHDAYTTPVIIADKVNQMMAQNYTARSGAPMTRRDLLKWIIGERSEHFGFDVFNFEVIDYYGPYAIVQVQKDRNGEFTYDIVYVTESSAEVYDSAASAEDAHIRLIKLSMEQMKRVQRWIQKFSS